MLEDKESEEQHPHLTLISLKSSSNCSFNNVYMVFIRVFYRSRQLGVNVI